MARMAKTIDSFTQNQTRLVVIIDGLDACEQDKVLQMLDTVRLPPAGLVMLEGGYGHSWRGIGIALIFCKCNHLYVEM